MEKGFQHIHGRQPRIVITGPESTGKTVLAKHLALQYRGVLVPEFAREFVERLNHAYTYHDVRKIARQQVRSRSRITKKYSDWIFFDTDLVITKVWFVEVYQRYPAWLERNIRSGIMDLYLLCNNEIPWEADSIRENGGARRDYLFERYREELETYGFSYRVVTGSGSDRFDNAVRGINDFLDGWK